MKFSTKKMGVKDHTFPAFFSAPFPKRVLRKAYEIFIHALHYDIEKALSNIKENVRNARNPHLSAIPTRNVVLRWRLMAGPPPADK